MPVVATRLAELLPRLLLAALLLLPLGIPQAGARTHALLFGVSDYPGLPPEKSLKAPRNDVQRMRRALYALGVAEADVRLLADGVDGTAGLPTRDAILGALTRLASDVAPEDFVIIYGSGHGSRKPSRSGLKTDGLDQVFLPRDTEPDPAMASGGAFRNAIVSAEFGRALDAIRLRGASVWFVLDSCFSGAASRTAGEGMREKMIDPADVGISVATMLEPDRRQTLQEAPSLPPGAGRLVAFYASQPNETAREVALPPGAPLERRSWGSIFTIVLTDIMQRRPGLSYRQVMVEAGRQLRADPAFQARQTPSYEGDALDAPMFGATAVTAPQGWRVADGVLRAGQLDGIEQGATISLFDGIGSDAKPAGFAVVEEVEALQAKLVMLKAGCDPFMSACPADTRIALPAKAIYARLAKPAPNQTMRLASLRVRPGAPAASPAAFAAWQDVIAKALAGPLKGAVVIDDAIPDILAFVDADGVRLMPPGADPQRTEFGPVTRFGDDSDALLGSFARAAMRARQVLKLQRLQETVAGGGNRELSVQIETRRFGLDEQRRQCRFAAGQDAQPVAEGDPLVPCDRLSLAVENQGRRAVLPMVFFLDDGWNLIARRPSCPVGLTVADRLEPGRRLVLDVPYNPRAFAAGRAPLTTNGVLVIGVPFREGETELPNLCSLTSFNDGPAAAKRDLSDGEDLDGLLAGTTRGGKRLPLDSASMTLTFWPVQQPVKP